mmetsp:Transcript_20435/g.70782  ORF Transcript_20435/g.70782 Transcript_20435/m.70782 type:complete len:106 (+) Transcript_20435:1221-1538(+)
MRLAHRYSLTSLYCSCELHVKTTLGAINCIGVLLDAQRFGFDGLRRHALGVVTQHIQNKEIQSTAPQTLQDLLPHHELMTEVLARFPDMGASGSGTRIAGRSSPY